MNYPENINDLVIIGAYHFETGFRNFNPWSELMIKQFGEEVKPYLDKVWEESQIYYNRELANKKADVVVAQKSSKEQEPAENISVDKKIEHDKTKVVNNKKGTFKAIIEKYNPLLPKIVLSVGAVLIALRLFIPPRYCLEGEMRIPYDRYFLSQIWTPDRIYKLKNLCKIVGLYLDFHTALLDSLGIAIITGISFYLLRYRKPK